MNYFAHSRRFLQNPYFVAGTAVPDWLGVVDRKVRARSRGAEPLISDPDPAVSAIAGGIVQHHHDDDWFHQTRAFAELSLSFAVEIRQRLSQDDGFRPSFLGHILVELLLDSVLIQESPPLLDQYYDTMNRIDPRLVEQTVNRIASRSTSQLALWIPRFCREQFLYDYQDDERLLMRLNHVMWRVKLPALPASLSAFFPSARRQVAERRHELLAGETAPANGSNRRNQGENE